MNRNKVLYVLGVLVVATLPFAMYAQNKVATPTAKLPPIPRMPDGKPDLSGVYQGGSTVPGTWEEANQGVGVAGAEDRRQGAAPRTPAPPRERPSYTPYAAKVLLDDFNLRNINSTDVHCVPNINVLTVGLFPVQIVQRPEEVVILHELYSSFRVLPITDKHPDDSGSSQMGNGIAQWEGDTLVTDVTDFADAIHAGGGGGRMHSDALHLTERFTRVDYN